MSRDIEGDDFAKPLFREIFGADPARRRHPYPRELFRTHEVYPLFVLDGGAFFWLHERVGGRADGRAILQGHESGKLQDLPSAAQAGSCVRRQLETMACINRLYSLLPLAQEFFRTGEERWAGEWLRSYSDWAERHPYRPVEGDPWKGDLVWFDMQVTWRLLILIHSAYLLAGSRRLGAAEWRMIYGAIERHAGLALGEARAELAQGTQGANHSLQRGTALLYAGALFPELGQSAACIEVGKAVVPWQIRTQLLADGGSAEGSPSYSHFVARQYVDAFVLLQKNGLEGVPGLGDCIQKQYEWLFQASSPTGRTLQVGDSYSLDVDRDLAVVASIFPLKDPGARRSVLFKESGFAVMRNRLFDVYVDAMKLREGHQHLGRPHVLLYVHGMPLLVDSGSLSYDHLIQESYLRRAAAHNVVVLPALLEAEVDVYEHSAEVKRRYSDIAITEMTEGPRMSRLRATSTVSSTGVTFVWDRTIILEEASVRIIDEVASEAEITCQQLSHLAPLDVLLVDNGKAAVVRLGQREVRFAHGAEGRFSLRYLPAVDGENQLTYSPTLISEARGTRCRFEILVSMEKGES